MQGLLVVCWALLALVGADECPDGGRCGAGQTCCRDPAAGAGCCPFDQAVCCEDHVHCCPAKTTCDVATSSCVNATASVPWVERAAADRAGLSKSFRMIGTRAGEEDDTRCPDWSRCPPEFSCLMALGRFGCCPLAQGVACSDGRHCCPEGHRCSADGRSCIRQGVVPGSDAAAGPGRTSTRRTEGEENKEVKGRVPCDDHTSCPESSTCCFMVSLHKWGCCPLQEAVCCADGKYCCPAHFKCDGHNSCVRGDVVIPRYPKLPASAGVQDHPGPIQCPEHTTPCRLDRGEWGCCPLQHLETVPLTSLSLAEPQLREVKCDDETRCEDGQTCCRISATQWGCCPFPNGVCCSDMMHCCPTGYTCTETGDCTKQPGLDWSKWDELLVDRKRAAKLETVPQTSLSLAEPQLREVKCDDRTSCLDGQTCCRMFATTWACCPYPNGVCCSNVMRCCPTGYTCTETGDCTKQPGLDWSKWDELLVDRKRAAKLETVPLTSLSLAEPQLREVKCDDETRCEDGQTCCRISATQWGCCPFPNGVCCSDMMHCCPTGYTCTETGDCTKQPGLDWSKWDELLVDRKRAAKLETVPQTSLSLAEPQLREVKCDDRTSCLDGQTCCRMFATTWACCPYPNGVCCSNVMRCCPTGYTCTETGDCTKQPGLDWSKWDELLVDRKRAAKLETVPLTSLSLAEPQLREVKCDDETRCEDGQTCCRISATQWGCCPFPNGVCCSDMMHCCPTGYTCTETGDCTKQPGLDWSKWDELLVDRKRAAKLETVPLTSLSLPEPQLREVKCDDETRCEDGQTCCRISATQWGCCPFPNAICCSDMMHCCPTGYTCTETGDCTKQTGLDWSMWDELLVNRKRAAKV